MKMGEIMNLTDLQIHSEYRNKLCNITNNFYIPLLSVACEYKRAVGFFSSTVLSQIADGISKLAVNGGKIQIIASPYLSDEDIEAIKNGYENREKIIKNALLRELKESENKHETDRLNLLSNLISDNILDIKIAFTEGNSKMGIYHEKVGLIIDRERNIVAFAGSMNETYNALNENYEVIDVFCSWKSSEQKDKTNAKLTAFNCIWNDNEPGIKTIEFPELKQEIIDRYKINDISDYNIEFDFIDIQSNVSKPQNYPFIPNEISLREYQIEAIDNWQKNNFIGIFDMATGTGKTLTGLGAIVRISEYLNNKLAVIIVCPYQHLVEQWVEDIEKFNISPIIAYSTSVQKDWQKRLETAILQQKLKVKNKDFFCLVTTNATFKSDKVQLQLSKIKGDILLVVDEAHNFGAEHLSRFMNENYNYRLALSATLERHNDENGTGKLYSYFGQKCIEYTLKQAIENGMLTKYKYFPIITCLNEEELKQFTILSLELQRCITIDKNGLKSLNERGKKIALKRARLIAGLKDKLVKLEKHIKPYVNDKHILVYCGATTLFNGNDTDNSEEIRQIKAVDDLLGNKLNMKISNFTSEENISEREIIKREFADGECLQALVAIKCLDEGVNIPAIKTAFILASTTNPKEYIQRRGRVLRKFPGKDYAEIYDFIALPRPLDEVSSITESEFNLEISLVKRELARATEFANLAMNIGYSTHIIDKIKDAYNINEYKITFEEEFNCD
ncbi:MAG: DEAD/DEAH box helicase family protein [Oscillospiraceae bacterium]|jgi:superfamily II DNA or RNA helicase|nr:DEAD/DEAH box helicase family protein [Oscillospiraceae bacterium]